MKFVRETVVKVVLDVIVAVLCCLYVKITQGRLSAFEALFDCFRDSVEVVIDQSCRGSESHGVRHYLVFAEFVFVPRSLSKR